MNRNRSVYQSTYATYPNPLTNDINRWICLCLFVQYDVLDLVKSWPDSAAKRNVRLTVCADRLSNEIIFRVLFVLLSLLNII